MVSPNPASPEAPPAVWSAVRALAHGHHLAGAEGLPQEHGEGALDVQDGGGPLWGERVARWRVSRAQPCLTVPKPGMTQKTRLSRSHYPCIKDSNTHRHLAGENEGRVSSPCPRTPGVPSVLGIPREGWGPGQTRGCRRPPPRVKGAATSHPSRNVGPPCQASNFSRKARNLDFSMKSLN